MLHLLRTNPMLDDYNTPLCDKKHYGPVLQLEGDFKVMRCTLCNQIFMEPILQAEELQEQRKSSRTCISACNWVTEGKMVRCLSCSYSGPLPYLSNDKQDAVDSEDGADERSGEEYNNDIDDDFD